MFVQSTARIRQDSGSNYRNPNRKGAPSRYCQVNLKSARNACSVGQETTVFGCLLSGWDVQPGKNRLNLTVPVAKLGAMHQRRFMPLRDTRPAQRLG